jgi:hypothetical protein
VRCGLGQLGRITPRLRAVRRLASFDKQEARLRGECSSEHVLRSLSVAPFHFSFAISMSR